MATSTTTHPRSFLRPEDGHASRVRKVHPGFRHQRFAQAAESIRYAIEKLSPQMLAGSSLEVKDQRYNAAQSRALYEKRAPSFDPQETLILSVVSDM